MDISQFCNVQDAAYTIVVSLSNAELGLVDSFFYRGVLDFAYAMLGDARPCLQKNPKEVEKNASWA